MHTLYSFELPASPIHGQFPLAKFRCKQSASYQVTFPTSHSRYSVSSRIEDVNCLDLLAQELGFVLKSEQREGMELLLRGKDVFCVLPTGFGKRLIYQDVCSCKEFFKFRATADSQCYLPCAGGSVENTRLLPHAKIIVFFVE